MAKLAVIPEEGPQKPPTTLGDVLYAKAKGAVPEQRWATLVGLCQPLLKIFSGQLRP